MSKRLDWSKVRRRSSGVPVSPVQIAARQHAAAEKSRSIDPRKRAAADILSIETPNCPKCGNVARLSDGRFGIKAECCGLWSWGLKSLVDRETHAARITAHDAFDPLWKSGDTSRASAYKRLAEAMGMHPRDCHISLMSATDARRVIACVRDGKIGANQVPTFVQEHEPESTAGRKKQRRAEIWIVIGADCPWNPTPGSRQVHNFKSRGDAMAAGFTA